MITPPQSRAARALLDWSQQQLADAAKVGNATIRNFEGGKSSPINATLDVLRRALEAAGVEFSNGATPGVRLSLAYGVAVIMRQVWELAETDVGWPELIGHAGLLLRGIRHDESEVALQHTVSNIQIKLGVQAPPTAGADIVRRARELVAKEDARRAETGEQFSGQP